MRRKPLPPLEPFSPALALADEPETFPDRGKAKSKRLKHQGDWEIAGIRISDHALVRWLEVRYNLDAKAIREEMVSNGRADIIKEYKTCKVPIGTDGAKLIVRDGLIVTVLKGAYPNTVNKANGKSFA